MRKLLVSSIQLSQYAAVAKHQKLNAMDAFQASSIV